MKSIYIVFEEEEFKMLKKAKKKLSWHDFVMSTVKRDENAEPELEKDSDFFNYNEAMEIIKELDPEYDSNGKSGLELSRYAIELSEKRNKNF